MFINLISKNINLETNTFPPMGMRIRTTNEIATVDVSYSLTNDAYVHRKNYGEIKNLPAPQKGIVYIVSKDVFDASDRKDVVYIENEHEYENEDEIIVHNFVGK